MDYYKKITVYFHLIYYLLLRRQHKRTHLMRCAFNWIHFCPLWAWPFDTMCVWNPHPTRNIFFFFQIKGIISSQKSIPVQRKAIISLTRMWKATDDRASKEQTCVTREECDRVQKPMRYCCLGEPAHGGARRNVRVKSLARTCGEVWVGSPAFLLGKSLLTCFILGRMVAFIQM